ncbi:MAG TPA: NAD(P)H-quinone oxidoreductase [Pyrinomonadaceae bacterium]|nr:NAD(P)H-quinone oxidoreductase [Pyrinomonadaceae bacterium]
MKAVYIREFGGPGNLEIREVPDLSKPLASEVLIRVKAAGLNRADLLQRRGTYPPPAGYSPNIPGLEFAGEVADIGEDVFDFKKGDRVFGITAGEAQAEFLRIDHRLLARIPDNLNFIEAGAVPEAFITAHDAVFTQGRLQGTETLLVHAAGSGVGLAAVQLGKASGHRVLGTSRTKEKLERCREFGLDEAIVAAEPKFSEEALSRTEGRGVDVILDLVGGAYFEENLKSLAVKGRLLLVGLTAGATAEFNLGTALSKRATLIGTVLRGRSVEEKAEATRTFSSEVVPILAAGSVRPNIDRVFSFHDVRAAHEYLESNDSFGKVVLAFD